MKKLITTMFLAAFCVAGFAQQPRKVTEKFFPDPAGVTMDIPIFAKKSGYTTHKEMMQFLGERIAAHPDLLKMEIVGQTQKGREIPMIVARKNNGNDDKIRVMYFARVHGDEPAGTEGLLYFIRRLAEDPELGRLLAKVDFYILPMVNADGGERMVRQTANGIDLNRDQSKLDTPEAVAMHAAANRVMPHVVIDFHEYQAVRSDFTKLSSDILSTPWDAMFLYSSNPNVPKVLRDTVEGLFVAEAKSVLDANKMTYHTYYTSRDTNEGVVMNVGGSSPRSSSNAFALRNSVSILMEIRGIKLERVSMLRRSYAIFLLAKSYATTAAENDQKLRSVIEQAAQDRSDVVVKFASKKIDKMPFQFLDLISNKMVSVDVPASSALDPVISKTRPMPEAYYLLPSESRAADVLAKMGVEMTRLDSETVVSVEAYNITSATDESDPIGGETPLTVTAETVVKEIAFPAGTVCVSTRQLRGHLVCVMLEPESLNGFVNFRVIAASKGVELPVYRVIEKQ